MPFWSYSAAQDQFSDEDCVAEELSDEVLGVLQSHSRSKDNEGMHGNGSLGNIREIEDIEGVIDFGLSMLERLAFFYYSSKKRTSSISKCVTNGTAVMARTTTRWLKWLKWLKQEAKECHDLARQLLQYIILIILIKICEQCVFLRQGESCCWQDHSDVDWNVRACKGPAECRMDPDLLQTSLSQSRFHRDCHGNNQCVQSQLLAAILFQSIERWAFVVANKLPDCPILNVHKQKGTDLCIEVLQVSKSKYWKLVVSISWCHCISLLWQIHPVVMKSVPWLWFFQPRIAKAFAEQRFTLAWEVKPRWKKSWQICGGLATGAVSRMWGLAWWHWHFGDQFLDVDLSIGCVLWEETGFKPSVQRFGSQLFGLSYLQSDQTKLACAARFPFTQILGE